MSVSISVARTRSTRGSGEITDAERMRAAGSETCSGAFCPRVETGALEKLQQEPFGSAATFVPLPSFMFIRSQCDSVAGVAHSASFDDDSAHADSGTGPNPTKVTISTKMAARRTIA